MTIQNPDPRESRNLIIAMGLVILIIVGWGYIKPAEQEKDGPLSGSFSQNPSGEHKAQGAAPVLAESGSSVPSLGSQSGSSRGPVLESAPSISSRKVALRNDQLEGSLRVTGARLDDLTLVSYKVAVDSDQSFRLLYPSTDASAYFVETGWIQNTSTGITLPSQTTVWNVDGNARLTPETPVTFQWTSPEGVKFERIFKIDENFLVTITDRVVNNGSQPISIAHYGQIVRQNPPAGAGFAILHEGPIGYFGGLEELSYDKLMTAKRFDSQGGWAGFSDKYWLTALIPEQSAFQTYTYRAISEGGAQRYLSETVGKLQEIAPNESLEKTLHVYSGAKVLDLLDRYEEQLGVKSLDFAVDFGIFFFLTIPLFKALNFLRDYLGNFGVAILVLTVLIKLLLFPIANKSFRSMAKMKALKPKLDRLKDEYGDDKMKFAQAQMELFKKEKVNPMSSCLPMLAQIPVFFALYKVLFISIEMRHAPFFGWIQDLSAPDPTSLFNLFGLLPFDPPSFLQIGLWPIVMGFSMFLQQKMNPTPQDPIQEKMFMFLPLIFTVMLANFPAGLVIYWTWNNLLSMAQQATIMHFEAKSRHKS